MTTSALTFLVWLASAAAMGQAVSQALPAVDCVEWHRCRELALEAAERGEYETFHDLAWRAVQTGPRNDPSLMYLLARAQSLSGRPHDALIMLQRLAGMGVASDAATNDDFRRARQHPSWPEVEALLAEVAASHAPPQTPPPPAGLTTAAGVTTPSAMTPAVRFSLTRFAVGGLAYDARSRRFVLGDRLGRKLIVVDEQSDHISDLVRADSAGFLDITAVEIDPRRGDLWVASTAPAGGSVVHKLQLVSGRPLRRFPVNLEPGSAQLVDLAVDADGAVLVLDSAAPQLLMLRAGGSDLERVTRIDAPQPVSVAAGGNGIAFVAHRDGVSRIDLRSRTVSLVTAPQDVLLDHLERIRWGRNGLIAVRVDSDGARRVLRLDMNARGTAVTRATRLETPSPAELRFATISNDNLVYLAPGSGQAGGSPSPDTDQEELVAYRIPLP